MVRPGKTLRKKAAKNGWAAGQTASQDNALPFSNRLSRDCAAGVSETTEKKSPVVSADRFAANKMKNRRAPRKRQVEPKRKRKTGEAETSPVKELQYKERSRNAL